MLSFYEFSKKLDEVGGGSLTNWLKDLEPAAQTKPVKPKPDPAQIGPGRSPMQTTPAPAPATPAPAADRPLPRSEPRTPSIGPVKDEPRISGKDKGPSGRFAHVSVPGAPDASVTSDAPMVGPARIPVSRQLDKAFRQQYGPDGPPETRALNIHPVILDLKQQHPDLAPALMAINGPFSKNKPFTIKEVDPKAGLDNIMAALQLLKQDRRLDFEDARGNPMKLNRADLPMIRIVPSDAHYRGDKGDLRLPSQAQRDAADRETEISPRYRSLRDRVGAPKPGAPKSGTPGTPRTPGTPKPAGSASGLAGIDRVKNKLDTLLNILGGLARRGAPGEPKHQAAIDAVWKEVEGLASQGAEGARASIAWKKEIENAAVKAGLAVPGQEARECVGWLDYYNLMETYRPSQKR